MWVVYGRRMRHGDIVARSSSDGGSPSSHARVDDVPRVVIIHAPLDVDIAIEMAAEMTGAGHDTGTFDIDRSVVDRVVDDDPDLVLLIRTKDSFSVPRICSELHEALACRMIVVDHQMSNAITPSTQEEARLVEALDAGADDYVSGQSPTSLLMARVRAALRARPMRRRPSRPIEIGDVVIDVQAHALLIAGLSVSCPPLQFNLLLALASRPNELVTRQALITGVWRVPSESIDTQRVRIAISVLRRILGVGPQRPTVESVARLGYRLTLPSPDA